MEAFLYLYNSLAAIEEEILCNTIFCITKIGTESAIMLLKLF